MTDESRIQVAVRVRPRLEHLAERYAVHCCHKVDPTTLFFSNPNDEHWLACHRGTYTFNSVFSDEDGQADIYVTAVASLTEAVLEGNHATIIAYGQTGSGKTYTMLGDIDDDGGIVEATGIFFRVLFDLFHYKEANKGRLQMAIVIHIVEIYNEEIRDLLNDKKVLQVHLKKGTYEETLDATGVIVEDMHSVQQLFFKASQQRATANHALNENSSRSHALFLLDIYQQEKTCATQEPLDPLSLAFDAVEHGSPPIQHARMSLVDLAGSERVKRSGVEGLQLKETQAINLSLTCLGNVVAGLYSEKAHIPYRDSKLTRVLKTSFADAKSQVLVITCLSPTMESFNETWSSVKFADRVKGLESKASFSVADDMAHATEYLLRLREMDTLCAEMRIACATGYCLTQSAFGRKFPNIGDAVQEVYKAKGLHGHCFKPVHCRPPSWLVRRAVEQSERNDILYAIRQKQWSVSVDLLLEQMQADIWKDEIDTWAREVEFWNQQLSAITAVRREAKHVLHLKEATLHAMDEGICLIDSCLATWGPTVAKEDTSGTIRFSPETDISEDSEYTSTEHTTPSFMDPMKEELPNAALPEDGNGYDLIHTGYYALHDDVAQVIQTLIAISKVAESSSSNRHFLGRSGAVGFVLDAMKAYPRDVMVQGQATGALLQLGRELPLLENMSMQGAVHLVTQAMYLFSSHVSLMTICVAAMCSLASFKANTTVIVQTGGLDLILMGMRVFPEYVDLLIRSNAALCNLAADLDTIPFIAQKGGIDLVLGTMRHFPLHMDLLMSANLALSNFAVSTASNHAIRRKGGIHLIINSIKRFLAHSGLLCRALSALCSLAHTTESRMSIVEMSGLQLIFSAMDHHQDDCALLTKAITTLWNLSEGPAVRRAILQGGGMELVQRCMNKFPDVPELVKEASGVLGCWKFTAIS